MFILFIVQVSCNNLNCAHDVHKFNSNLLGASLIITDRWTAWQ